MDCPYIIAVNPTPDDSMVTVQFHLAWLKKNHITKYRWNWQDSEHKTKWMGLDNNKHGMNAGERPVGRPELQFRFESEHDKLLFALRWA